MTSFQPSKRNEDLLVDKSGQLLKITFAWCWCLAVGVVTHSAYAQGPGGTAYPGSSQWESFGQSAPAVPPGQMYGGTQATSPGNDDQYRFGMPASGAPVQPVQYTQQAPQPQYDGAGLYQPHSAPPPHYPQAGGYGDGMGYGAPPIPAPAPNYAPAPGHTGRPLGGARIYDPPLGPDAIITPNPYSDPGRTADLTITAQEAQTGRFQFGVGVNSDAGVTGSIVIDERNFDWRRYPQSFDDIWNGRAWRGAGQGFRIEAMPGSQVQRYMVSFSEPYLMNTRVSMNLSAYLFDRIYRDWDEQRVGGRVGLGYRLTPDLSTSVALRMENVDISDPRIRGVAPLEAALGDHGLYTGTWNITHDTRDFAFAPTEGHLFEISLEQAFGDFDYSRAEVDFRQYFLLAERPDGSGRHTLGLSARAGFSGSDTPIFENFYAGGFSTLRGFDFRRVGPKIDDVFVGGPFRVLGSVEYLFPITADDMVKGVLFTDVGAVEESTKIIWDDFAVSPGFGLRISVPALGQAPIALDFAFPINRGDNDETEMFSFFIGAAR